MRDTSCLLRRLVLKLRPRHRNWSGDTMVVTKDKRGPHRLSSPIAGQASPCGVTLGQASPLSGRAGRRSASTTMMIFLRRCDGNAPSPERDALTFRHAKNSTSRGVWSTRHWLGIYGQSNRRCDTHLATVAPRRTPAFAGSRTLRPPYGRNKASGC